MIRLTYVPSEQVLGMADGDYATFARNAIAAHAHGNVDWQVANWDAVMWTVALACQEGCVNDVVVIADGREHPVNKYGAFVRYPTVTNDGSLAAQMILEHAMRMRKEERMK